MNFASARSMWTESPDPPRYRRDGPFASARSMWTESAKMHKALHTNLWNVS